MIRDPLYAASVAVLGLALALAVAGEAAAQIRPSASYRVIESAHFHVTYGEGLEPLARRVVEAAERSHAGLESTLSRAPSGKVDILLVDGVDFSNGFASPFPSNRIVLYARPPVDDEALSYSTDWLELVVSHELTHTFQMDRAGRVGRALRSVFGRMPLIFPMFPSVGTPAWSTEGLAVDVESSYTGQGRGHGSDHEMIVRTAVLAGEPDRMGRLNEDSPIWPGGQRAYIYGSLFMAYLSEQYGEDVYGRILDRTASAILPPFLFWDNVAYRAFGTTFDAAYESWLSDLNRQYAAFADSLSASGLTESERLTDHGRIASDPRVSPDGRRLVYTAEDGKANSSVRTIDSATGDVERSIRRNGGGVQTWLADGRLLMSQYEFDGPYRILSDLWIVGRDGGRLTNGARLQAPDVSVNGRIIAVQNGGGGAELALVDPRTGETRTVTAGGARVLWSFPRWSPDGSRIAASRWTGDGEHAIVVMDTMGASMTTVISGTELNLAPAWSPDGNYLLFSSDRTGITNLYAADLRSPGSPRLWQVTNVLTGAFDPEVSPDGATIYFSKYHANGYAIERMPFDPAAWRAPSLARLRAESGVEGEAGESVVEPAVSPSVIGSNGVQATAGSTDGDEAAAQLDSRPYSPWRTLAPTFWAPVLTSSAVVGTFLGATIRGEDIINRHAFRAAAAFDIEGSGRWEGGVSYSNARLGNPVMTVTARRQWSDLGAIQLTESTTGQRLERDDAMSAYATFVLRRWRTSASLSTGIERQWYEQMLVDQPLFRLLDPEDTQTNLFANLSVVSTQLPPYAISREDGYTFAITVERSLEDESTAFRDSTGVHHENYTEWRSAGAIYKSVDAGGFAHHVIALRGSGFLSTGRGAGLQRLGGATGSYAQLLGFGVTGGSRLLPVRGFTRSVLAGTRAWTATAEWRAPIALVGRRPSFSPFFIDRISANAFLDAGDAWCSTEEQLASQFCRNIELAVTPIVGVGAELAIDFGFAGIFTGRARAGFGVPLRGPQGRVRPYLLIGSNF
jgi:Tol biopolymer transport system component